MAMSMHIRGFRAPDEKWQKMKDVWEACQKAGIEPPDEVDAFFEGAPPDPLGVEVTLGTPYTTKFSDRISAREGYIVDLKKLPPDLTHIKFFNSY